MSTELKVMMYHDDKMGDVVRLLEPHAFVFKGKEYVVPVGFESDGASVPRFFWRMLSPKIYGVTLAPSIEHDFLYDQKAETRQAVDAFYRDLLIEEGYSKWKANLTYLGVRMGGGSHWKD